MTHPKGTSRGLATGLLAALLILGLPPLILVHDAYAGGKKLPGSSLAAAVLQRDVAQQIAMPAQQRGRYGLRRQHDRRGRGWRAA